MAITLEREAMNRLDRTDVLQLLGQVEELTVAEILATGATSDERTRGFCLDRERRGAHQRRAAARVWARRPPDRDHRGRRKGTAGSWGGWPQNTAWLRDP